jgi:TolA-binding protein
MKNKILGLYFSSVFLLSAVAFADQPKSSLDDKPSVDTAASTEVKVPAVPSDAVAAADSHTSYLYDLKRLIDKSRENIREVNEKIKEQAVLKRNQKREERAREYYEKGLQLTNEGKLAEAREYFEKAIRITDHPEMSGYIRESQRRLKLQENALRAQERAHDKQVKKDQTARQEDVEEAYKQAVDLYRQKKFHPAKDAFEHVNQIAPEYRATDSYLKIIDQEIIASDALAAKKQAAEVQRQQKEAEAARAKEKELWLKQVEQKEKERKIAVDKQAQEVYDQAVDLYKAKKFAEAKKKFEEVSWVLPDYKATMKYLARIDKDAQDEEERDARQQQKAEDQQRWEATVESKKKETQQQKEMEAKQIQQRKVSLEQAEFLYPGAVSLYNQKKMDGAWDKFNDIEKLVPDFKDTRSYLKRISAATGKAVPVPAPPVVTVEKEKTNDFEDQQKDARILAVLAEKSAQLYRQIAEIADDRPTERIKRKLARLNDMLIKVLREMERILGRMREVELRHRQEELKTEEEQRRAAVKTYEEKQAEHNKVLESRESVEHNRLAMQEQEKQRRIEQQQLAALEELAEKASAISDEIIRLSRQHDYEGMKAKFTELENTIAAVTALKNEMGKQKSLKRHEKEAARETARRLKEAYNLQNEEHRRIHEYEVPPALKINRPPLPTGVEDADKYKRREISREQDEMFRQGVDCYEQKRYAQAKLLFTELAGQHYRKAESWVNKADRAIAREILHRQETEAKQRTAFLAEQLKAQRRLAAMQERERQRQKKLTEELEKQRRLYEDERLMQWRKEETMKAQERERQKQEEKRLRMQAERQKEQEMYRFHKIGTGSNLPPEAKPAENPPVPLTMTDEQKAKAHMQATEEAEKAEALAMEKKHRREFMSQQEDQQQDLKREAELKARREVVRRQLEKGVEVIYQNAVKLYKQGKFALAADRFRDVQDILPGYKRTAQYLDEARTKSGEITSAPMEPVQDTSSVSRQASISKALDLFEANVK